MPRSEVRPPRRGRGRGPRQNADGSCVPTNRPIWGIGKALNPKRSPSRLPADRLEAIEALRRLRMTASEIAEVLGMALSTVSRWLAQIGLGKRSRLEPPEPPNRYERKRPGELIHVDVKKLGRISARGAGHRVTGIRGPSQVKLNENGGQRRATGWEFVHVCVDDATRLAHVEVLPDEKGTTAAGFLRRAVDWFKGMGIGVERVLSDNGACYRSRVHAQACAELEMRHIFTRPYRPRTNGKAERFIQTLTNRWAYGAIYGSSAERAPGRCLAGSTTTTSGDDTAPSATGRPRLGSPSWNNVLSNYN